MEGVSYSKLPLGFHLTGLPEIGLQTLAPPVALLLGLFPGLILTLIVRVGDQAAVRDEG
jgi:hypothetical protein